MRVLLAIPIAAMLAFTGCLDSADAPAGEPQGIVEDLLQLQVETLNFTGQVTGGGGLNAGGALSFVGLAPTNVFDFSVPSDATNLSVNLTGASQAGIGEVSVLVYRDGETVAETTTSGLQATITIADPASGSYSLRVYPSDDTADQVDFTAQVTIESVVHLEGHEGMATNGTVG